MSDQLITVATFNFSTDLQFLVFKSSLEHHGIAYFAAEEHTVNANPFLSISVGGIRVMVHEDDVPAAIGIWREINEAALEEEPFGEHEDILDDVRMHRDYQQEEQPTSGPTGYFILVAALIGLLLLFLLFAIWKAI